MPEQLSHHQSVQDTGDDSARTALGEGLPVPSSNGASDHPSSNGRVTPRKTRQKAQETTTPARKRTRKGSGETAASSPAKARRKKKDEPTAADPARVEEEEAVSTPTPAVEGAKKSAPRKRAATSRKKQAAPAVPAEPATPAPEETTALPPEPVAQPVEEADSADFEPELDTTPIKPRSPFQAQQRAVLFAFSEDALAPDVEQELLEETARRPSVTLSREQGSPPVEELPAPSEATSPPEQTTVEAVPLPDAIARAPESAASDTALAITPAEPPLEGARQETTISDGAPEAEPGEAVPSHDLRPEPAVAPEPALQTSEEIAVGESASSSVPLSEPGEGEAPSVLLAPIPETPFVSQETPVIPVTPIVTEENEEEQAIPATPFSLESIPETPPEIEQSEPAPSTTLFVEGNAPQTIPETPLISTEIEQEWDLVSDAVLEGLPVVSIQKTALPMPAAIARVETPPITERKPLPPREISRPLPAPSLRAFGPVMALFLLALFLSSSFLLWRDVRDTHLFLSTLDPASGQIASQQDLGGGYQNATALTNPVLSQSALFFGVSGPGVESQQLFTLGNDGGTWRVASQLGAPLEHATLSITPNNLLVIQNTAGLQVMTSDGRLLWQVPGQVSLSGAHAFQPAADSSAIYTIKDARAGLVVAYDQQSGATRWTQQLNDSLLYAAPLLSSGSILYIAADHTIYALDQEHGGVLWRVPFTARTLLMSAASAPLLLAVGANGLAAFDPASGRQAWLYTARPGTQLQNGGENGTLSAAQLYQATLSGTDNTLYATGIAWDTAQAREQTWLFAVDAATGHARWSERVGSGFASADSARVSTPQVDTAQGLLLLEQLSTDGAPVLNAYDTRGGALRWSQPLGRGVLPTIALNANDTISIISLQSSSMTTLLSWSWLRTLLFSISLLAGFSLLLLWLLPLPPGGTRAQRILRRVARVVLLPFKLAARLWRFSRPLFALAALAILVGTGALSVMQQLQPHRYLNALALPGGATQWQQIDDNATSLVRADTRGSLLVRGAGDHLRQLSALDSSGASAWSALATEGTLSLPTLATPPGTFVVALSGQNAPGYRLAPDDPAYPSPVAHLFSLALLDRATGQVLWQRTITRAGEQQETSVLSADSRYLYLVSRALAPGAQPAVAQLIAVDVHTGGIAWRVFGPREAGTMAPDWGFLLPSGRLLYWQVAGAVYALDTETGQEQWRHALDELNPATSVPEEARMAIGAGVLLVQRSDLYYALDLATGKERWSLPGLGSDSSEAGGGIVVNGSTFILYSSGAIEAIDANTQATLWKYENFVSVQDVIVSSDGSLVYALEINSVDGTHTTQSLVALDAHTKTARWTFQPSARALFVYPGSQHMQYARGSLFVTLCLPGNQGQCDHQTLYQLNAQSGAVDWKFEASAIDHVQVSQSGVAFQTQSTGWENLKRLFTR